MKNITKLMLVIIAVSGMIFSCTKPELLGEEVTSTTEGFFVSEFSVSDQQINFNEKKLFFNAQFSEEVTAKVELVGQESGAVKLFLYSFVSELNEENSTWKGEHDGLTFFRKGEKIVAKLTFYGHDKGYYDTLFIIEPNDFSDGESVFSYKNNGVEDGESYDTWSTYKYGDNLEKGLCGWSDVIIPVQGDYSYRLINKPNTPIGYIGGGDFNVKASQNGFVHLSDDSENVWFNCYVYSAKKSSGNILISFAEADGDLERADSENTDKVNLSIPLNFEGWKLISKQYTKIPFATISQYGGNGNKDYEPNKIEMISFQIESTKDQEIIDVAFDNFIFTVDYPFY